MNESKINWNFLGKAGTFVSQNAATLSMIGSIVLEAVALVSAFKASDKVTAIHEDYVKKVTEIESEGLSEAEKAIELQQLKLMRNIQYVNAEKVPIMTGLASMFLSFNCNRIRGIEIAGLSAVIMTQKDKIQSLVDRTKEMIGEEKFLQIENKSLEDLVMKNFINEGGDPKDITYKALRPTGDASGMEVFLDTESGAMFLAKRQDLLDSFKWAENEMVRSVFLTQDKYCEHVGYPLPDEPVKKCRAWGPKNPFKAHLGKREIFGMTLSSVEFDNKPQPIDCVKKAAKLDLPWRDK